MSLNLIVETPAPKEEFEYIVEEGKNSKDFFIKGPYMMAEGVNRNKRIYPLEEMEKEVKRY